jgi:23S rRNA (guanosine2251-2'-O)-methyltransferase
MSQTYIGGFHAVLAALEDPGAHPQEILLADTRRDARAQRLLRLAAEHGVSVRQVARDTLDLYAPGLRHQGVLAVVEDSALCGEELLDVPATPERVLLALDGVQDPHNLGACLRTAEAAGASAVIVPKDRAAGLTPVARKAAAGAAERVPLIAVTNLARTLDKLKALGYWITGLSGQAQESIYALDFAGPQVLVLGGEGHGLRRLTAERCDRLARIPMLGRIESLNVSVAAAVCLYEAYRQRHSR